jgi:RNA polymerase sigma factor (sigma-70 family)
MEDTLIDSALQGRDEAFGDLIQPYMASLTRFARLRLRSDPEAEDIVQQAILRALSHLRQFRGEASFKTWLTTIASNEVSQWRRGRAVAPFRPRYDSRIEHDRYHSPWRAAAMLSPLRDCSRA